MTCGLATLAIDVTQTRHVQTGRNNFLQSAVNKKVGVGKDVIGKDFVYCGQENWTGWWLTKTYLVTWLADMLLL